MHVHVCGRLKALIIKRLGYNYRQCATAPHNCMARTQNNHARICTYTLYVCM